MAGPTKQEIQEENLRKLDGIHKETLNYFTNQHVEFEEAISFFKDVARLPELTKTEQTAMTNIL